MASSPSEAHESQTSYRHVPKYRGMNLIIHSRYRELRFYSCLRIMDALKAPATAVPPRPAIYDPNHEICTSERHNESIRKTPDVITVAIDVSRNRSMTQAVVESILSLVFCRYPIPTSSNATRSLQSFVITRRDGHRSYTPLLQPLAISVAWSQRSRRQ